ncbi:collagen-like protein [Zobellia roscoffensis]|uniref:collagen-like protein n=1 Tax=Zobellia roscoffensis TaxID=2779508 RepID=UPI00188B0E88|nr:collagen-like protein [Zobellia roscoffensis]
MKTTMKFFSYGILILTLLFASCTEEGDIGPIGPEGPQGIAGIDGADGMDGSDGMDGTDAPDGSNEAVITNSTETVVPGSMSTLHRDIDGVTAYFKTTDLIPNNAYTLWFVIFGETPGPPVSTFAAGHVAGETGTEIFAAFKSIDADFDNPMTGEIHLALRTHGPVQSGMILDQIQTMDGGCTSGFDSGPGTHPDSDEVGYCANVQVAKYSIE